MNQFRIRAFGHQNNNSTIIRFKAAFKRLLIITEIKGTTGNCKALDYRSILNATSTFKSDEIINRTLIIMRFIIDDYQINNKLCYVLVAQMFFMGLGRER